jgi:hypothetical protein
MMRRNRPFYDGFNEIAVGMRLLQEGHRVAEPADLLPSRLSRPRGASNLPPFARFEVFASPGGSDDLTKLHARRVRAPSSASRTKSTTLSR